VIIEGTKRAENSHIWQREEHEHYVEPEWCSRRLFDVERFEGPVLDPACGFGRIPESARAAGLEGLGSDIVDRGYDGLLGVTDFLASTVAAPNVVSNPPFDLFEPFARHALSLSTTRKVALIWLTRRINAARWLQATPLARLYYLTPRPSMPPGHVISRGEKPGGGKQDFCWLVWDKAHVGPATVHWLHREPVQ
jgi:hypothetical protein